MTADMAHGPLAAGFLAQPRNGSDCSADMMCAVQLSIMRILHKILTDRRAHRQPAMAELLHFATSLVRSLLARLVPITQATGTGVFVARQADQLQSQRLEAAYAA